MNKTGKSNNNNITFSRNHSSSGAIAEQKINVPGDSIRANFPNLLMSINNVYNFDAHPWPKNTILIAVDSMINGINEKRISTNFKSVKVRCGATIDDMYFGLILLLRGKAIRFSFTGGYRQFVK